jgi:hypothetical protein
MLKRRELLGFGLSFAGALAARSVIAEGTAVTRAAIVIGVDKVPPLRVLRAAAAGAHQIADWLQEEGFAVSLFVDDDDPVTFNDIYNAINDLVNRNTLEQLVVYFGGHGFLRGSTEVWLLSDGLQNPNEAINLLGSSYLSREVRISNVVFISDACRSLPSTPRTSNIHGGKIFPLKPISQKRPDIDLFYAASPGDPAYEVPSEDSIPNHKAIYTECFRSAFRNPDESMVRTVGGVQVVPNNKLKPYLEREVPKMALNSSVRLYQIPETIVTSGDDTYIGRTVLRSGAIDGAGKITALDVFKFELWRAGLDILDRPEAFSAADIDKINRLSQQIGFDLARTAFLNSQLSGLLLLGRSRSGTSIIIAGAEVAGIFSHPSVQAKIIESVSSTLTTVDVTIKDQRAATVAIQFADKTGTVVAALSGFVCTVVLDRGGVINVSYAPSVSTPNYSSFMKERAAIVNLNTAMASAARHGVFRIDGNREARLKKGEILASRIKPFQHLDPALLLYSAYALADADIGEQVHWLHSSMQGDLQTVFFDIALLTAILSGNEKSVHEAVYPFCPMLSKGWDMLEIRDLSLPPTVKIAGNYLRPALWTTFNAEGMRVVVEGLRGGELK